MQGISVILWITALAMCVVGRKLDRVWRRRQKADPEFIKKFYDLPMDASDDDIQFAADFFEYKTASTFFPWFALGVFLIALLPGLLVWLLLGYLLEPSLTVTIFMILATVLMFVPIFAILALIFGFAFEEGYREFKSDFAKADKLQESHWLV